MDDKKVGVAILAATGAAGLHSAIAPSVFTFRSFANDSPRNREAARDTILIAALVMSAYVLAVALTFREPLITIFSAVTAALLIFLDRQAVSKSDRDGGVTKV